MINCFVKKIHDFFVDFWKKSNNVSRLSFLEKLFFLFLIFIEKIYSIIFFIILFFKKNSYKQAEFNFKIISIGNISVGGTGKSVFVQFLIKSLDSLHGAVVLRGYRSKAEKMGESFLVSDGSSILLDSVFVGDEAFMFARNLSVPVVVGSDRVKSCLLLNRKFKNLDYIILDDAYQNFSLKKNFEILLLDSTKPFENGHCLPAGRLREKDFSRPDVIILTHSDSINGFKREKIKDTLSCKVNRENIFFGTHLFSGVFFNDFLFVPISDIIEKRIFAFAGIGFFGSFLNSVKRIGLKHVLFKEYPDHHVYTKEDFNEILDYLSSNLVDVIITTQKDWAKIYPFLPKGKILPFYTLSIGFGFLTKYEEYRFFKKLNSILS